MHVRQIYKYIMQWENDNDIHAYSYTFHPNTALHVSGSASEQVSNTTVQWAQG